jgi:DnaJ-domain-containing protein 1
MQRAELGRRLPVGLAPFKQSSEHAEALLIDLVALSLRDGELHDNEVCYVREVAAELGVSDSQIDTMLKLEQEKA